MLATARVFAIPMRVPFRGITVREGVLVRGPAGWAEFAPFLDYDDAECVPWWRSAVESATVPWPAQLRTEIPLNATVPVVPPARAAEIVAASGCSTAKVKVADPRTTLGQDADRVAAVREAIGPAGHIRIDANAAWTQDEAVTAIGVLDRAAGGLQYAEQPCASLADLAAVRRRVAVPIAADESIRRAADPLRVAVAGAADIAVIKVAPLGGVHAALAVARAAGLPVVVSSAVDTVVGIAAGLALAAALPELPYACGLGTASLLTADVGGPLTGRGPGSLTALSAPPAPDDDPRWVADPATTARWLDRLHRVAALAAQGPDTERDRMGS
ncbi:o-succinylbenzoate synthase [Nakamurella flavida]|uniref:o-succinylbenzoate synthase n=1 Tax=Nakamurella flavida TaxID=363630 RepID=UPI003F992C4B